MAVHAYTGVTGKITVSGTIVGFVSGDFTLAAATGKYTTLGSNISTAHTRGLRTVNGTLRKAWGVADDTLYDWLNLDTELDITFDPEDGVTNRYTASGCVLTDLAIEGLEAGSDAALMINASFEGLNWSRA